MVQFERSAQKVAATVVFPYGRQRFAMQVGAASSRANGPLGFVDADAAGLRIIPIPSRPQWAQRSGQLRVRCDAGKCGGNLLFGLPLVAAGKIMSSHCTGIFVVLA
jgi:hypothetical protein